MVEWIMIWINFAYLSFSRSEPTQQDLHVEASSENHPVHIDDSHSTCDLSESSNLRAAIAIVGFHLSDTSQEPSAPTTRCSSRL